MPNTLDKIKLCAESQTNLVSLAHPPQNLKINPKYFKCNDEMKQCFNLTGYGNLENQEKTNYLERSQSLLAL